MFNNPIMQLNFMKKICLVKQIIKNYYENLDCKDAFLYTYEK